MVELDFGQSVSQASFLGLLVIGRSWMVRLPSLTDGGIWAGIKEDPEPRLNGLILLVRAKGGAPPTELLHMIMMVRLSLSSSSEGYYVDAFRSKLSSFLQGTPHITELL
jgi:hypothetical protein